MYVESFFQSLGQALGAFIRFIVEGLSGFFNVLTSAVGNFIDGLSSALGVTPSLLSILFLVIGLLLLYSALRAFMRGSLLGGLLWLVLGLWLLGGLIR